MKFYKFLWWWGPVLAWCALIFWLSATPNLKISSGESDFWLRKTAHMVVYALLFLMVYRALLKRKVTDWQIRTAFLAAALTMAYALSDEFHQSFVPTRDGSWTDIMIDGIGVAVAFIGLIWLDWWNRTLREAAPGNPEENRV